MAQINRLSARGVASITEPGRHADGGNLYLNVTKTGAKSWVFFYRLNKKQREMGLGPYPAVSLADAREAAIEARRLLAVGEDPLDARKAARAAAKAAKASELTFGEYADQFIQGQMKEWKNEKHRAQWQSTLGDKYIPELRKRPIAEVDVEDVLAVLRPIWNEKRETANRIRQRVERVLDAAMVEKKRPESLNPARWRGHLDKILPAHGKASKGHFKAMPWQEVPAFMAALEDRQGVSARAVEFVVLCAARSGEVRGMRWSEVDFDKKLWTIPPERMKAGREHRVPLSDRAVEVVQTMLHLRPRRDWEDALVFPGMKHGQLSDMTLGAVLKRMKIKNATIHGFRSAFRDWCGEATSTPFEVAEMALAHQVGDATVRAYLRGDLFEKRRALMDQWAAFCSTLPDDSKVVPLKSAEAQG